MLEELSKKKNTSLTRGKQIVTQTDVTKSSVLNPNTETINTKNIPANVRVDQGIRNSINALSVMGYGESQREVVSFLIESFVSTIGPDQLKKFEDLNQIYDEKDFKSFQRKQEKKNI